MNPQNSVVLIAVLGAVLLIFGIVLLSMLRNLLFVCGPNELLIFSGRRRRAGDREVGYRLVKGGWSIRRPLIERVDRIDLTNMTINVEVRDAFSSGGIPLTVQGVANTKIAGDEPLIHPAIERFLGKNRDELTKIIKDTLEGNLRGILAKLTPEQVNEDKLAFAQHVVEEAEDDLRRMGLVLDTLKIQNVTDDVGYLDAIGRRRSADLQMRSMVAEAKARALAAVRAAENLEATELQRIDVEALVAKAEAARKIADAETKKAALIAEKKATVASMVARAQADIPVQEARREQVRLKLDADVVRPAVAKRTALEADARGAASVVTEQGKATVRALDEFVTAWAANGDAARDVVMMEKLAAISKTIADTVRGTAIDRLALLDDEGSGGGLPKMIVETLSQLKAATGADPVKRYMADGGGAAPATPAPTTVPAKREPPAPRPT